MAAAAYSGVLALKTRAFRCAVNAVAHGTKKPPAHDPNSLKHNFGHFFSICDKKKLPYSGTARKNKQVLNIFLYRQGKNKQVLKRFLFNRKSFSTCLFFLTAPLQGIGFGQPAPGLRLVSRSKSTPSYFYTRH